MTDREDFQEPNQSLSQLREVQYSNHPAYHPSNRAEVRLRVTLWVLFLDDARHAKVADLWLLIVCQLRGETRVRVWSGNRWHGNQRMTYENVSRSKITMNNVVVVKVKKTISDLHCKLALFGDIELAIVIIEQQIETSATTVLEHNARIGSIETHSKGLNEVWMWCNTTVKRSC